MKLNDLTPNYGAKKNRKRLGHGLGAGQGRTCGRGTKGQNSRSGEHGHIYRQGGNLPFYRRLPFIRGEGFTPPHQVEFSIVNLAQLESFKKGTEVSPETLINAHLVRQPSNPIAILGRGDVKVSLKVRVHRISKTARAKIEAAGGSVEIIP